MKLKESKLLRGDLAMTRMEWLCSEFETKGYRKDKKTGPKYIACVDYTVPSHAETIFFTPKGQPPERFDWNPNAIRSTYEQLAFAQIVTMDWDKLKDGDELSFDSDMEKKIRKWDGRIWSGGAIVNAKKTNDNMHVLELKEQTVKDRDMGHYVKYFKKNKEY
jgi:hypothetical protein